MQTQKGSNGYQYRIVCRNCDKLLFMIHKDVNYVQLAAVCDKLPRFLNRLNLGEGGLPAPAPATGDLGMSPEKPDEDDSSSEDPMPDLMCSSSEEKREEGDVPAAPKDAHAHDEWEVIDAKKDDSATKPDCRIV